MKSEFTSFEEFYPFYIDEHKNKYNKLLHFIGTWLSLVFILLMIFSGEPKYLFYALLSGYSWAWVGHFFIEKTRHQIHRNGATKNPVTAGPNTRKADL